MLQKCGDSVPSINNGVRAFDLNKGQNQFVRSVYTIHVLP